MIRSCAVVYCKHPAFSFHLGARSIQIMLRVIDRYLLKEVGLNWVAVTLVLWLIVVSNRLARFLGEAAAGDLPGNVVFTLLGLKSIEYLVVLLPLTLYLGVLLALGRLYKDSEMAALGACGVGPAQLYRPLLMLALPVAALVAALALFVAPQAASLGNEVRARAEGSTDLSAITAGRFHESSQRQAGVLRRARVVRPRASRGPVRAHRGRAARRRC
jgi:lipopolysaccharide export system permease protein